MKRIVFAAFFLTAGVALANPFQSNKECAAGLRVQVKDQGPGTIIGPSRYSPSLTCQVKLDSGTEYNATYWNVSLLGAANKYPDAIKLGAYSCGSFTGAVGHGGHIEVIPTLDFTITGPSTYVGFDKSQGRYSYDQRTGLAKFLSGTLAGREAQYDLNGVSLNMLNASGQGANETCGTTKR